MRLFRVFNRARAGRWFFAESEARARVLALADGFVRKPENITAVKDQTDFFRTENPTDVDAVKVEGTACVLVQGPTNGAEVIKLILAGKKPEYSRSWCVYDPIQKKTVRDLSKGIS
jgi:hypothetical protein